MKVNFQDYLPLRKMFQDIYHKANQKLKTQEPILPQERTEVKKIALFYTECVLFVWFYESSLLLTLRVDLFPASSRSPLPYPPWSQPHVTSQTSRSTGTAGTRHSIGLFRKDKVLVLMKSLLENLRVQKSMWIQRAPEHWSQLLLHWQSMPCLATLVNRAKRASSERSSYHLPRDPCLSPPFPCLGIDTAPAMIYNHTFKSFEWNKLFSSGPHQRATTFVFNSSLLL